MLLAYLFPSPIESCNCNPDPVVVRSASTVLITAFCRHAPPPPPPFASSPMSPSPSARICILAALIGAVEGKQMVLDSSSLDLWAAEQLASRSTGRSRWRYGGTSAHSTPRRHRGSSKPDAHRTSNTQPPAQYRVSTLPVADIRRRRAPPRSPRMLPL